MISDRFWNILWWIYCEEQVAGHDSIRPYQCDSTYYLHKYLQKKGIMQEYE